jgi:hypothetical protein
VGWWEETTAIPWVLDAVANYEDLQQAKARQNAHTNGDSLFSASGEHSICLDHA